MAVTRPRLRTLMLGITVCLCAASAGCLTMPQRGGANVPNEKNKTNLPDYTIEPPDVLLIDAIRLVPKQPHKLEPFDSIYVVFPTEPDKLNPKDLEALEKTGRVLNGVFRVEPSGNVRLGSVYGSVAVIGLTIEEAEQEIVKRIKAKVKAVIVDAGKVTVELAEFRAVQGISGEHLVRADGTINLGTYGNIYVTSLTEKQAKAVIEEELSKTLQDPEILLQVGGFNSRKFYLITDGAGNGEPIQIFPITGNETVLDALTQVGGLPGGISKARIWLARPAPGNKDQILAVNWRDITRRGRTETNYQLLPGDRIYLAATPLSIFSNYVERIVQPVERIFSALLFGQAVYQSIRTGTSFFGGGFGGGLFPFGVPQIR